MSTFKTTDGDIPLDTFDIIRIHNLVADNITVKNLSVDVSDASSVLFLWDMSGSNFQYSGNVEFPGDISGTTGKYIYKNLVDASSSWDIVASGQSGNNIVLRNKSGGNYNNISINNTLHHGSGASLSELTIDNTLYSHFQGKSGYGIIGNDAHYSHIQGYKNTVLGRASHAEGHGCVASGTYSHAEGILTTASGIGSHSEGIGTSATGKYSHASGLNTTSSGIGSVSRGVNTHASGYGSLAEGYATIASGHEASHAEGYETVASGLGSHAAGLKTTASGDYSLAAGYGTTISKRGGVALGTYNASSDALFVVGIGSEQSKKDAFVIKDDSTMAANISTETANLSVYRSKADVGGVTIFGEDMSANSLTAFADIRAASFSGNGLYLTDVKGWNFNENNFITNAKTFVIEEYSGMPVVDTSMSALKIEAVKTMYFNVNSENVLLSEKNIANEVTVTNKKSGYVYVKPKADYGPGSKMTLHFPPHTDASDELLNVQVFNDSPVGIKIGNELINVTKYVGKDVHIVFDGSTNFDADIDISAAIVRNSTTNYNSCITYTNDTESVVDRIYLTDASGILYAINSKTHELDFSYNVMFDVPASDGIRARYPNRGLYAHTCDGVSIGRDGTIYACFAPPEGEYLTSGGALVALYQNGTQKWKKWTDLGSVGASINYNSGTYSNSSMKLAPALIPVIADKTIFVVPSTGVYSHLDNSGSNFTCFDVVSQNFVWQYGIGYQNQIKTPPVVNKNGRVFYLYTWVESGSNLNNTVIEAIDRNSSGNLQRPLWTFSGLGKSYTNGSSLSITQIGEIIVCTVDGVYLVEEYVDVFGNTQGRIKWNYIINNIQYQPQSISRDGTIYLTGGFINNYKLYAVKTSPYNDSKGLVLWETNTNNITYGGTVVDKDGIVYLCNIIGVLYAINSNGTIKWTRKLQNTKITWAPTPAIGANGTLYVTVDDEAIDSGGNIIIDSYLVALKRSDGSELWRWKPQNRASMNGIIRTSNIQGQWPMYGFDYTTKGSTDFYNEAKNTTYSADMFLYDSKNLTTVDSTLNTTVQTTVTTTSTTVQSETNNTTEQSSSTGTYSNGSGSSGSGSSGSGSSGSGSSGY